MRHGDRPGPLGHPLDFFVRGTEDGCERSSRPVPGAAFELGGSREGPRDYDPVGDAKGAEIKIACPGDAPARCRGVARLVARGRKGRRRTLQRPQKHGPPRSPAGYARSREDSSFHRAAERAVDGVPPAQLRKAAGVVARLVASADSAGRSRVHLWGHDPIQPDPKRADPETGTPLERSGTVGRGPPKGSPLPAPFPSTPNPTKPKTRSTVTLR